MRYRNMPAPARPARTPGGSEKADGLDVHLGPAAGHDLAGQLEGHRRLQLGLLDRLPGGYPTYGGWGGYPAH